MHQKDVLFDVFDLPTPPKHAFWDPGLPKTRILGLIFAANLPKHVFWGHWVASNPPKHEFWSLPAAPKRTETAFWGSRAATGFPGVQRPQRCRLYVKTRINAAGGLAQLIGPPPKHV